MNRINEKTMIPLSWAVIALTTLLGPAIAGSMWVRGVNDRLSRIEHSLQIDDDDQQASLLFPSAKAGEKKR